MTEYPQAGPDLRRARALPGSARPARPAVPRPPYWVVGPTPCASTHRSNRSEGADPRPVCPGQLNVARGRPPLPAPRSSRDRARSSIEPVVLRRSGYPRGNSFEQNNPIGAPRLVIAAESPSVQTFRTHRRTADTCAPTGPRSITQCDLDGKSVCQRIEYLLLVASLRAAAPSGAGGLARPPAGRRPGGLHEVLLDGGHTRPPRQGSTGRGCGCAVLRLHLPWPAKAARASQTGVSVRHYLSVDRPGCRFRASPSAARTRDQEAFSVLRAGGTGGGHGRRVCSSTSRRVA